jgi:hypothetical protein
MPEFSATLLREKFVIQDALPSDLSDKPPIIALSNRIMVPLINPNLDEISETFVIRAQNMHSCVRLAAHLTRDFQENGPILTRSKKFDWDYAYISLFKGYEKKWNPNRWVAVYNKGRLVFEKGEVPRHPFLDIIEQCDARNKDSYDKSVNIAQDAFHKAGKTVTIQYDSNVAMVLNVSATEGRCGVILRGPNRTTTFNFTAKKKAGREVKPSQCLSAAAAFLEGIQMTFLVGMARQKQALGLIDSKTPEAKQGMEAGQKLGRLKSAIDQFENLLEVTYRPDRPDFTEMVDSAVVFARKLLEKQMKDKVV